MKASGSLPGRDAERMVGEVIVKGEHVVRMRNGFYYVTLGAETHYRPSYFVWMNKKVVEKFMDAGIIYPHPDNPEKLLLRVVKEGLPGKIVPGKSERTLRWLLGEGQKVFYVEVPGGYRGGASLEVKDISGAGFVIYDAPWYMSPRGSTGIGRQAFIVLPPDGEVLVEVEQWGRLYGAPDTLCLPLSWETGWGDPHPASCEDFLALMEGSEGDE